MKIIYKNNSCNMDRFGNLCVGQTFFDQDQELCIKTEAYTEGADNCISISEKNMYTLSNNTMVQVIKVESITVIDKDE